MTLRSALQDLRETTLAAVSGLLAQLAYIASLRRSEGRYLHWGLAQIHGEDHSERALQAAHTDVLSKVLSKPIVELVDDLGESSQNSEKTATAYVDGMRQQYKDLLPSPEDQASAKHLNSVLLALSRLSLEKSRKRATPSVS